MHGFRVKQAITSGAKAQVIYSGGKCTPEGVLHPFEGILHPLQSTLHPLESTAPLVREFDYADSTSRLGDGLGLLLGRWRGFGNDASGGLLF